MNKKPTSEQISKLLPNTFPFPNVILDHHDALGRSIWSVLVGPEQNLLTVLYRKTFGWWKERDRISTKQLVTLSGLSDDTVKKYMGSLVAFGLALRLSDGEDGKPVLWEVQIQDEGIDFAALLDRKNKMSAINATRWNNGRGILSDRGGSVGQEGRGAVGQEGRGAVGQTPQKPLSKTTNKKPLGKRASARIPSEKIPDDFPHKVQSLATTFMRLTGLKVSSKIEFDFWVYGSSKNGAKGFEFMQSQGITSNDLEAAYKIHMKENLPIRNPNSIYPVALHCKQQRVKKSKPIEQDQDDVDPEFVAKINGGK